MGKVEEYVKPHRFLRYVARFWTDHFRDSLVIKRDAALIAFLPLYDTDSNRFRTWFQIYWNTVYRSSLGPEKTTPLLVAAYFGHTEVIKQLSSQTGASMDRILGLFSKKMSLVNVRDDDERTPLCWAALNGHTKTVQLLLEQTNIEVDAKDSLRRTPLIDAAINGHSEIVKLLLKRRDVSLNWFDDRWRTALSWAAEGGHLSTVELLLARKDIDINLHDRYERPPVCYAAEGGHLEIVRLFFACPNLALDFQNTNGSSRANSPLASATQYSSPEIFALFVDRAKSSPHGFSTAKALLKAADDGATPMVHRLLQLDPAQLNCGDSANSTPLGRAASRGRLEAVQNLLSQPHIAVNAANEHNFTLLTWAVFNMHSSPDAAAVATLLLARPEIKPDMQNYRGETPLSVACESGRMPDVIASLLERKDVDVNARDNNGLTPLMHAALRNSAVGVRLLLARKDVLIDAQDRMGLTALSWAARHGEIETLRLLLGGNARADIPDVEGRMAVDWAKAGGHAEVAWLIERREGVAVEGATP